MLAIASDHGGFELKQVIKEYLDSINVEYKDYGTLTGEAVDYPDIAKKACEGIISGECERGILICGTGTGINISANKIKGIRAAQCSDTFSAKMCRQHNNANVLTMGGRIIGPELAKEIVHEFLTNEFLGDRHERRVNKIIELDNR